MMDFIVVSNKFIKNLHLYHSSAGMANLEGSKLETRVPVEN